MVFDPLYLLLLAPAMLLGLWAQFKVKSAYHEGQSVPVRSGLTGAEAARRILDDQGLQSVDIELSHGVMSDHYDPAHKVLRLSHDVAYGRTAAALGIAAHGPATRSRTPRATPRSACATGSSPSRSSAEACP